MGIELTEEELKKLSDSSYDFEGEDFKKSERLLEAHRNIIDILKDYCDIKEEYFSLVALWIIGTYCHEEFTSYPYLFFNAMRGSGKTRILKLVSVLSYEGQMLNSLTEAVLFRTKGMLAIDEFEGANRKGNENLRELLNSAYKKGTTVKRMKKKRTVDGEDHVVEEFTVYRPISIANIGGMDNVLGDRCIELILEKSDKKGVVRKMEIFETTPITTHTKSLLFNLFKVRKPKQGVVSVDVVSVGNIYKAWNDVINKKYVNNTNYTYYTDYTNNTNNTDTLINKLLDLNIDGRHLELSMPLFIIAMNIGEDILDKTIETITNIINEKKEEDIIENTDVSLYDYFSQELETNYFIPIGELTKKFREFLQSNDDWINTRWMGRAMKRLELIKEKRRKRNGVEIIPNYQKAQKKIKMFR